MYSWGERVSAETARGVWYQVTGKPFNAVPPPKLYAGRVRWSVMEEEFTWDTDQGGDAVAGRVKGLSLIGSRQDGMVDAAGGWSYVEWTMEFQNVSARAREARAQIALPPGGVVSRLTLWINGEEQEAAFGGRSQVKEAYKKVVQQSRDPVVVTTLGPDRVLVQCFPVPREGGTMKIRIGITSPLPLADADTRLIHLPSLVERNFSLQDKFEHAVWVESAHPITSRTPSLTSDQSGNGRFGLHGSLKDAGLATAWAEVQAPFKRAWTRQTREASGLIQQDVRSRPITPPDRLIIVVDATEGTQDAYGELAEALAKLPPHLEAMLLVARDGVEELVPLRKIGDGFAQKCRGELRGLRALGGHDNVPALIRAWELASQTPHGVVLWLHGPQPVILDHLGPLEQRLRWRAGFPLLMEVQTRPGPNRVLEGLGGAKPIRSLARLGSLRQDLERLFTSWSGNATESYYERSLVDRAAGEGAETSMHLARLWAAGEAASLAGNRNISEATALALRYQLVTPLTGAVVLETLQQYVAAGLEQVSPDTVPVVPEPNSALLLLLGLLVFAFMRRHRPRRAAC
jgi:hypothetical protein